MKRKNSARSYAIKHGVFPKTTADYLFELEKAYRTGYNYGKRVGRRRTLSVLGYPTNYGMGDL